MTEEAPPGSARHSGWSGTAAAGSPAAGPGQHRVADIPDRVGDWSLTQVAAGMWLSPARDAPLRVAALRAEPGRASVIVDADGPDARTDELLRQLFPLLASAGLVTLRLVLSAGAGRYAAAASRAFGLDLIAAPGHVTITPYGYAVVRPADPVSTDPPPQWRRCLPAGSDDAAGILAPSPGWERPLTTGLTADLGRHLAVRRVPAGIALEPPDPEAGLAAAASSVWPDPERLTVVLAGAGPREMLRDGLAALLPRLLLPAADGVRLYWPRAAAGADGPALQELAARCGTDLIAPAADVSDSGGFGGACHGPGGAAPWLRFTRDGNVQVLGSLYPVPAWEWALGEADLGGLADRLVIEHVAAGVCVYRPDSSARGLIATARSVIPDPARATIVLGGDVRSEDARQDLEAVLSRLPGAAVTSLRILLANAGSGEQDSYAQFLADTFNSQVIAPAGRWTATPDGRLRVLPEPRPATATQPPGDGWQACWPRGHRKVRGQPDATISGGVTAQAAPRPAPDQLAPERSALDQLARGRSAPDQLAPGRPAPDRPAPDRPGSVAVGPAQPSQPGPLGGRPPERQPAAPPSVDASGPAEPSVLVQAPARAEPWLRTPAEPPARAEPPAPAEQSGRAEPPGRAVPPVLAASPARAAPPAPAQPPARAMPPAPAGSRASAIPEPSPPSGPSPPPGRSTPPETLTPPGLPAQPTSAAPAGPMPLPASEPAVPPRQSDSDAGTPTRVMLLPRHHRSSAQERSLYREAAAHYPKFSVSVRRILNQRPGLRVAAVGDEQDAVVTDFAAVLDMLSADQQAVAAALRLTGTVGDPRVACALSGLRRLPSFTGVVFSSARSPGWVPRAYAVGQLLTEPAFVQATSSWRVALEGGIEYVIWSETGKRVAALAADADADEIIFAAGTAYRVLHVSAPSGGPIRVFLRESASFPGAGPGGRPVPLGQPDGRLDEMTGKVLERLVTAAARHDDAAAAGQVMARPGTGGRLPIGVDASGAPFQQAPTQT